MKKILAMAAVALSIFILQMPQAAARDEHMGYWEGGWKAYLMTETIKLEKSGQNMIIYCRLKAVQNTTKYFDYAFTYYKNSDGRVSFRDSSGASGSFTIGSPGVYQVEHNTAIRLIQILDEIKNASR